MTERLRTGSRRMEVESPPVLVRVGKMVLPLAILALVATLVVFGDSIFDGGAEPKPPEKGETAAGPIAEETEDAVVDEERAELEKVAASVLRTWARPGAAYTGWWRRLEPMLTPGGRQAYAFTDPAQVPDLRNLEVEDVVLHTTGVTATVYFTTSEGRFGVDLSRRTKRADWLANRVVFPDGESMFA